MADIQHIFRGSGAPLFAPSDSSHHYTDITNGDVYLSKGNASPADWILVPRTTTQLPEGTNLYFTNSRASSAAPVQSVSGRTGVVVLTSSDVGLINVDNTSDVNKPVSTLQAAADAAVQAFSIQRANHTGTQAAGTITGLAAVATSGLKADVGLSLVPNVDATQRANHTGTQSYTTITGLGTAANANTTDFTPSSHVGSGGSQHSLATSSVAGFMSAADKSKLDGLVAGDYTKAIFSISTTQTLGSSAFTDYFYFVSGTTTVTLPTAVGNSNRYTIKRVGTGTVTVNTTSSQTIDGSLTAPIKKQYDSLDLMSDGSNWNVI
jgi:hypothetical protein